MAPPEPGWRFSIEWGRATAPLDTTAAGGVHTWVRLRGLDALAGRDSIAADLKTVVDWAMSVIVGTGISGAPFEVEVDAECRQLAGECSVDLENLARGKSR